MEESTYQSRIFKDIESNSLKEGDMIFKMCKLITNVADCNGMFWESLEFPNGFINTLESFEPYMIIGIYTMTKGTEKWVRLEIFPEIDGRKNIYVHDFDDEEHTHVYCKEEVTFIDTQNFAWKYFL